MATRTQYLTNYYKNPNDMNSPDVVGLFVNEDATPNNCIGSTDTTANESGGYNFAPSKFGVHLFQPKKNIMRVIWHDKNTKSTFKFTYWDDGNKKEINNNDIYSSLYKKPKYNNDGGGLVYDFCTYCYDIKVDEPGKKEKYYFYQIQENGTDNTFGSYFRIVSKNEPITVGIIGDSGVALNGIKGWTSSSGNNKNLYVTYINQIFYSTFMKSMPEKHNFSPPDGWKPYYMLRENIINSNSSKDSYITYKMPMTNCYLNQMMHVGDMTYVINATDKTVNKNYIYDTELYADNNFDEKCIFFYLRTNEKLFSTVPFVPSAGNHGLDSNYNCTRSSRTLSNFFHFFPQSNSITNYYYCDSINEQGIKNFNKNSDTSDIFTKLDELCDRTSGSMDSTIDDNKFEYTLAANIISNNNINNFQIINGLNASVGSYACMPKASALCTNDSTNIKGLDDLISIQNPSICIAHIDSLNTGFNLYITYNAHNNNSYFRINIAGSSGDTQYDKPTTRGMIFLTYDPSNSGEECKDQFFWSMQVNCSENTSDYSEEPRGTGIWYSTFAETPQNIGEYNTILFNKYSITNINNDQNPKLIDKKKYYFYNSSNPMPKPKPTKDKKLKKIWYYDNRYNIKKLINVTCED